MSASRSIFPSPRHQRGMGLIEVLIAVLVMAIGLLGIAAMQATALRNGQSALERSQAVVHTYTITDAMRANREAALADGYKFDLACAAPAAGTLAANDIGYWMAEMKKTLGPATCGAIQCANQICTITVQWDDSRATAGGDKQTIQTQTRL